MRRIYWRECTNAHFSPLLRTISSPIFAILRGMSVERQENVRKEITTLAQSCQAKRPNGWPWWLIWWHCHWPEAAFLKWAVQHLLSFAAFVTWKFPFLARFRISTRTSDSELVDQLIENSSLLKPTWPYSSSLPARDSNLPLKLFVQLYFRVRKWAYHVKLQIFCRDISLPLSLTHVSLLPRLGLGLSHPNQDGAGRWRLFGENMKLALFTLTFLRWIKRRRKCSTRTTWVKKKTG